MILLCIRGALVFVLSFGGIILWVMLLVPGMQPWNQPPFRSPEYYQARADGYTALFGGIGLLVCLAFVAAVVAHYWFKDPK